MIDGLHRTTPTALSQLAQGCEARATSALAPQEKAGQLPADLVTLSDANCIVH